MKIMTHLYGYSQIVWHLKFDTKREWSKDLHITAYWNAGYPSWGGIDDFCFKSMGDTNSHIYHGGSPPVVPNDFINKTRQFWELDLQQLKKCVDIVCMEMASDPVDHLLKKAKMVDEKKWGREE